MTPSTNGTSLVNRCDHQPYVYINYTCQFRQPGHRTSRKLQIIFNQCNHQTFDGHFSCTVQLGQCLPKNFEKRSIL